jgi:hypothetical protein
MLCNNFFKKTVLATFWLIFSKRIWSPCPILTDKVVDETTFRKDSIRDRGAKSSLRKIQPDL